MKSLSVFLISLIPLDWPAATTYLQKEHYWACTFFVTRGQHFSGGQQKKTKNPQNFRVFLLLSHQKPAHDEFSNVRAYPFWCISSQTEYSFKGFGKKTVEFARLGAKPLEMKYLREMKTGVDCTAKEVSNHLSYLKRKSRGKSLTPVVNPRNMNIAASSAPATCLSSSFPLFASDS